MARLLYVAADYSGLTVNVGSDELEGTLAEIRNDAARETIRDRFAEEAEEQGAAAVIVDLEALEYDILTAAYRDYRRRLVKRPVTDVVTS